MANVKKGEVHMYRSLIAGVVLVAGVAVVAAAAALAGNGPLPAEWQEVRAAVAKYHSFEQAERDGYTVEGEACVALPSGAAMGIHAINPALLADPAIDPLQPELLLYVPKENGKLAFVGVEYWTIALANTASGPAPWFGPQPPPLGFFTPTPSVLGQPLDGPFEGHVEGMPWHYDVHVWVAESNPSGLFAPFNPTLSC
jgi:hypothetical protein